MAQFIEFISSVDRILWGPWTIVFIASVAIYFSIRSRFFQIRKGSYIFNHSIGGMFKFGSPVKRGRISPFQATSTALASTVGMGNMAGVATALSIGGPGAIFWMWLLALLSMILKTAEITLAVHFREVDKQGNIHGGPMYYIRKGLGWNTLAILFCVGILINSLLSASLLQAHTVGRSFLSSYGINPYWITGGMALLTGIVVFGGVRRIGRFCGSMVPFMSLLYIGAGLFIIIFNYQKIPEVFESILVHAFSASPAMGGFAGATVAAALKQGMAKGMLSHEAGLGTAPMIHANARTAHPFQQGMWGSVEVFFDTIVICTITSFAILSTGVLNSGDSGIEMVIAAFSSVLPPQLAGTLISFSILTFCLTTQIGFFIYFETALLNLIGARMSRYLRWIYLLPGVIFAGVSNIDQLWNVAGVSVFVCSIPNLIALLALSAAFFKLMKDYTGNRHFYSTERTDGGGGYVSARRLKQ